MRLLHGDCREVMKTLPEASVDAIVCDPPYDLTANKKGGAGGFMGMAWDATGVAFDPATWREALRVLKPGGHLLAFSGTRTYHRMVCAIEDAGFEIRDQIGWVYGSGFPKSLDVSKAIDRAAGAEREFTPVGAPVKRMIPGADQNATGSWIKDNGREYQPGVSEPATEAARHWQRWGTALKPAWEPIVVARKPLIGTVAENVLAHGTGALNIDGCRVEPTGESRSRRHEAADERLSEGATSIAARAGGFRGGDPEGRWPANLIHDGSDEVLAAFPNAPGGSAARFFYCAKASKADRGEGNTHPTVKPTDLMRYLCRLVTPPGGTVLDPFMGSGSTLKAAVLEGFNFIGCDLSAEYLTLAKMRLGLDEDLAG